MLAADLADLRAGAPAPLIAARFHAGLALAVRRTCAALRERTGCGTVALSGGVFLNVLLTVVLRRRLRQRRVRGAAPPQGPAERRRARPRAAAVIAARAATDGPGPAAETPTCKRRRRMCLAVPGRVLEIGERDGTRMAKVDFGGVVKEVCLEYRARPPGR